MYSVHLMIVIVNCSDYYISIGLHSGKNIPLEVELTLLASKEGYALESKCAPNEKPLE